MDSFLKNFQELISSLKNNSIDVNGFNESGYTPLHSLIKRADVRGKQLQTIQQRRNELVLVLLTNSNADVDIRTDCALRLSPLHLAVQVSPARTFDLRVLMEINYMQLAGQEGDETCVKMLLAFDADINARDARERTPLDIARSSCNLGSIEELLTKLGGLRGFSHSSPPRQDFQRTVKNSGKSDAVDKRVELGYPEHGTDPMTMYNLELVYLPDIGIKKTRNGYKVLCLDGGGIRGLVQIEVLCQLERTTGRKITELFDWVVGTSTGAFILLTVIYGK